MKAISVRQPWASLLATGTKEYETRSWTTGYRGAVAIHAAKALTKEEWLFWREQPFYREFLEEHYSHAASLPRGCVIAIGELVAVYDATKLAPKICDAEIAFGNFAPGRYAWRFAHVKELAVPVPGKGQLGLFDWLHDSGGLVPCRGCGKLTLNPSHERGGKWCDRCGGGW